MAFPDNAITVFEGRLSIIRQRHSVTLILTGIRVKGCCQGFRFSYPQRFFSSECVSGPPTASSNVTGSTYSIIQQSELTMFYKAFALLLLAGTVAQAADLPNGLYRIASTKFEGAVIRSFRVGGTVSLVSAGRVFDEHQWVGLPFLVEFTSRGSLTWRGCLAHLVGREERL
jgi:hypothetical protein